MTKTTRRAFLSSVLALIICLTMLIGTTFAWFTDTASTAVNTIKSGTLDIELQMKKDGDWVDAKDETLNFVAKDNRTEIWWEPGCTYSLEDLRIINKGNLAVKYTVTITGIGGNAELNDVIDWTITVDGENYSEDAVMHLAPTETHDITISGTMQTTAGNEYMDKKIENIAITVCATQDTVEYDSTTNLYDEEAGFGWDGTVATQAELDAVTDTENKTVKINSANLLAALAVSVNNGNSYYGYTVTLEKDLNLNNQNWTPIGTQQHPFNARVFDGQGHTISNLRVNGGADNPIDTGAVNQGLFGYTYTNGNIIEIMNLNIHNADIYAKNSAGVIVGNVFTAQSSYWQAGYTAIHHVNLTGKVRVEGGNSGGISGSGTGSWALQTQYSDIVINVDEGSYVSNVKATELSGEGVGTALGGIASIVAWGRVVDNIESNLDVIGMSGYVGGIIGIGNQYFENITYTGNVTVKNVTPKENGQYQMALVTGVIAPTWNHSEMTEERQNSISATGTLTIELTDGTTLNTNGQSSNNFGGWAW